MDDTGSMMNASDPSSLPVFDSEHWRLDTKHIGSPKKLALLLVLIWLVSFIASSRRKRPNAPIFGYRSIFEPTVLLQTRFILGARDIIRNACQKMKNQVFVLRRYDVDFMVLPIKYLEDIRLIPSSKLSCKGALAENFAPRWMSLDVLLHSPLHIDAVKKKLTPELYKFVDRAKEELAYGWHHDLPHTDDWTEVSIEHHMRMLLSRMASRVFVGGPTCRNPEWLKLSAGFSVDLFIASFTIKMFPPWMAWLIVWLIPARYRALRELSKVTKVVGELTKQHNTVKEKRAKGEEIEEEDTLLNWMLDNATPSELNGNDMGARQCLLSLASIHTTAPNLSNVIYDLCAYPEWFNILREEIFEAAKELGPPGLNPEIGAREWCSRLDKLDSFIVESQRHNPLLLLNPQRLAYQDVALKDGTHIPTGTILSFANYEHSMNPDVFDNPREFDPMRSYRKRMSSPDQREQHKAGMTHPNNLAFGYGNQACPGRQFAVAQMKLIMCRLLYEFEIKFPGGKTRPETQFVNENCFTDQNMALMMRKRKM
ncbi:Cytochrome P450 monooxygenase ATR4 [Cladobotryum mycophilum]|uniref:Cytochrome P450 monooxygenase ATR4 n=1 Tax=Cladobotryum mycophilum TaxID=491253 RepID=A0ABR0T0J0_9HYPO